MVYHPKHSTFPVPFTVLYWLGKLENPSKAHFKCFSFRKENGYDPQKKSKVVAKLYENLKKSGVEADNLEIIERETKEF